VTVPELVSSVIDSQVRPYCARHKLCVDSILLSYIKVSMQYFGFLMIQYICHFVQRPENQMKSSSDFALERKIVALVKCISNQQVGAVRL